MGTATEILSKAPQQLLRPDAQRDLQQEIESVSAQIGSSDPLERISDKGKAIARRRRLQKDLDSQSVPALSGEEIDSLRQHGRQLEEQFLPEMPPRDVMMRNPAGAVGKNIQFEKRHKQKILDWKRIQLLTNRDSDDPDVANVERIRPEGNGGMSMANAQIAPKVISVPSAQYMENHDQVNWEAKATALEAKLERLEKLIESGTKIRKPMSEEAKQRSRESLARARAIKNAKAIEASAKLEELRQS